MSARLSAVPAAVVVAALAFVPACARDTALPTEQSGRVIGQLLAGDAGLADVDVALVSETLQRLTTRTDGQGAFTFVDVPAGLHTLDARPQGLTPPTLPQVRVRPGATLDLGALVFTPGPAVDGTIKGVVVGPSGMSAAGAEVTCAVAGTSTVVDRRAVGESGSFVLRVPPGVYALVASHPLYTSATRAMVAVRSGELTDLSTAPLALGLDPATLAGAVTKEQDGRQVPASGAQVTIQPGGLTTTTDVMGRFSRGGLAPGTYTLSVSLAGYHPEAGAPAVMLAKGMTTETGTHRLLLDRGSFRGTVVTGDRQPATNVRVVIQGTTFSTAVVPDMAEPWRARFQLDGVPVVGGPYVITAQGSTPGGVLYTPDSEPNQALTLHGEVKTLSRELQLAVTSGDFSIDDGDATSLTGFTRVRDVTLDLTRFTDAVEFRASEAADFADAGFRSFSGPSQAFQLADADGTHTVYAEYRKAGGVTSARFQASIVLDRRAPQGVSIALSGGETFTNDNPLTLRLAAVDEPASGADRSSGLTGMRLSETGAVDSQGRLTTAPLPVAFSTSYALTQLTQGARALFVQFTDAAGNVTDVTAPASRLAFVYDTVAPVDAGITLRRGAQASADGFTRDVLTVAQLTAAPEPVMGTLQVKLANSQAALSTATYRPFEAEVAHFLAVGPDGPRTVYARLIDAAGNESPELSAAITLDTTAPSPLTVTLVGSNVRATPAITLSISAMDSSGLSGSEGVTISESVLFTAPGQTGPKALSMTGMESYTLSSGDGLKNVYVRARDRAGNDAVTALQVVLDATAPVLDAVTVDGPLVGGGRSTTVTSAAAVTLRLDATGATRIAASEGALSCAGAMYVPFNGRTFAFTLSAGDGPKTVNVCVADDAGNTSGTSKAGTTRLATAAPTGCALSLAGRKADGTAAPAGRTATAAVTATVSGCSPAGNPPVALALTTSMPSCTTTAMLPYQAFSASTAFTLTGPDGANTLYGCVRDEAGNVGAVSAGSITLDRQGPVNVSVSIDNGAAYVNGARFGAGSSFSAPVTGAGPADAVDWAVGLTPPTSGFVAFVAATPLSVSLPRTEGTQRVWGVFRDDLGNATQVSDTIDVDTLVPTAATLGLQTPSPTAAYSSSVSVTLTLTGAGSDTADVLVANAAGAACADTDFTGRVPAPRFDALTFLLTGGDGLKRVCARQRDAAGNLGPMLTATTTLDTVAPTAPEIVTQSTFTNVPGSFTVTTRGPVTEANFAAYLVSGATPAITPLAVPQSTTTFQFTLPGDGTQEEGVKYTLRLWARDLAGNTSPPGTVDVTVDTNAPPPPNVRPEWVENGVGKATIHFSAADAGDVADYRVFYASDPAPSATTPLATHYTGTFADQGPSPVSLGLVTKATVSGLPNGSKTYVSVRSVDRAGNVSPPQDTGPSGTRELVLQANEVPFTVSSAITNTVTGGATHRPVRMALLNDLLFVAGVNTDCSQASLNVYDVSQLSTAVQRSVPVDPATTQRPVRLASRVFPVDYRTDNSSCHPNSPDVLELVVEYPYAFISSGGSLLTFSILDPANPSASPIWSLTAPVDGSNVPRRIVGMKVRGNRQLVTVQNDAMFAVRLDPLYDGSNAALPTGTLYALSKGYGSSSGVQHTTRTAVVRRQLLSINVEETSGAPFDSSYAFLLPQAYGAGMLTLLPRVQASFTPIIHYTPTSFTSTLAEQVPDPLVSGDWVILPFKSGLRFYNGVGLGNEAAPAYPLYYDGLAPNPFGAPNGTLQTPPLAGSQLFVNDGRRLGVVELADAFSPRRTSTFERPPEPSPPSSPSNTSVLATLGPFLFVGTESGRIETYQVAQPRSLAVGLRAQVNAGAVDAKSGFLFGNKYPLDLLRRGQSENAPPTANAPCIDDVAVFEDGALHMQDGFLRTVDSAASLDRVASFVPQQDQLGLAGQDFWAIEASGNLLVAVRRASTTDVRLEVYDASALRDLDPATGLASADLRGALTVATQNVGRVTLKLHRGRAFVALNHVGAGPYLSQVVAVDLRAALDEDPATPFNATAIQGRLTFDNAGAHHARSLAVSGNRLWVTLQKNGWPGDSAGVALYDASPALDNAAGTLLSTTPTAVLTSMSGEFIDVAGGYAVTFDPQPSRATLGQVRSFDVSTPTAPLGLGTLPLNVAASELNCRDATYAPYGDVKLVGSRAYVSFSGKLNGNPQMMPVGEIFSIDLEAP